MKKIIISIFLSLISIISYAQSDMELTGNIQETVVASSSIRITNATILPGAHLYIDRNLTCDIVSNDQNYSYSRTYDITGKLVGEGVSYFDVMGKNIQTQSRDILTNKVWVNEIFYDEGGRPAVSTMPVPDSNSDCLLYRTNFTRNENGNSYSINDYNTDLDALAKVDPNSDLGKYYGPNHPDPYHDIVEYPMTRTVYDPNKLNQPLKSIGGNKNAEDEWINGYAHELPAAQEMYYLFGKNYWNKDGSNQLKLNVKKTVVQDADGKESVVYTDHNGQVLATALSGRVNGEHQNEMEVVYSFNESGYLDIHLPEGYTGLDIELINANDAIITDLRTNKSVQRRNMQGGNVYRISKGSPVTDLYLDQNGTIKTLTGPLEDYMNAGNDKYVVFNDESFSDHAFLYSSGIPTAYSQSTITVDNYNNLYVNWLWTGNNASTYLKLGPSHTIPTSAITIDNLELGYFTTTDYSTGVTTTTPYRLKIVNNQMIVYSSTGQTPSYQNFKLEYGNRVLSSSDPGPAFVRYKVNYHTWSLNYYDKAGKLTKTIPPIGVSDNISQITGLQQHSQETTYNYNIKGQLLSSTSVDEGTSNFKYRSDDLIRFSQNTLQASQNRFSYTDYGPLDRPIESGECSGSFTTLNPDGTFTKTNCTDQTFTTYDYSDPQLATELTAAGIDSNLYQQTFVMGAVSKTSNNNTTTWYSYDYDGKVLWIVQKIDGLGIKTIDYTYDLYNNVTNVVYQKNQPSEYYEHRYTYDEIHRLIKAETKSGSSSYVEHAQYNYNEEGQLTRLNLANNLQGIDYVYNYQGLLKSINHPSLNENFDPGGDADDVFGLSLDYYNGDYKRDNSIFKVTNGVDSYTGNIKAMTYNTANFIDQDTKDTYYFGYNHRNWLSWSAKVSSSYWTTTMGYLDESQIPTGDYNTSGITYDRNGNIQTLNRNKQTENGANAMDQLRYVYDTAKPNQLKQVIDSAGDIPGVDDISTQPANNYIYNEIGQLTRNNDENISYIYNASGLVTEVQQNNQPAVKFFYNDKNHRVKKESYNLTTGSLNYTDFYVRDASGTAMAIYRKTGSTTSLVENTVYGAGRLGVRKADDTFVYELTDHLGNVRAVIARNDNTALLAAADYYPGGMAMPNRNVVGDYRYNYQGQELDEETGKVAFELRLYDPRINRWMAPDPAKQYPSPYMSMGNNWVNQVDPDGAKAEDWYFNSDTNELEWHAGSSADSASNLTWVGTDSASSEYLSSISTTFGGSGEVPFSGGLYWQGIKDYGSARWEQIKKGQIMPPASLSVLPGKGVLVNSEQIASNVQTANWLYETDFGNAEYAYYGGQFTGALGEAALLRGAGKLASGYGFSAFGGRFQALYANPSARGVTLFAIQNSSRLKTSTWHFRLDIHRVYSLGNRQVLHYHSALRNGLSNRQWFKAVEHSATPLIKF
ncbi:RHS repeat domain-containing protein [Aquimarina brevivitae]|uniref:RHS repeat-associated protein n=1 Tax=Aquimarina brevivitae TaxID=323412 RepID=A0A4Q7NY36_9FLAO|nr:RHS repeat-associated core domain-containing protein [Aquimarina brevivitae]RZS92323.1 RHS repeat-associated protein [Aquimarina brevivitae]